MQVFHLFPPFIPLTHFSRSFKIVCGIRGLYDSLNLLFILLLLLLFAFLAVSPFSLSFSLIIIPFCRLNCVSDGFVYMHGGYTIKKYAELLQLEMALIQIHLFRFVIWECCSFRVRFLINFRQSCQRTEHEHLQHEKKSNRLIMESCLYLWNKVLSARTKVMLKLSIFRWPALN